MTAREKFKKGDRVSFNSETPMANFVLSYKKTRTGTVIGFSTRADDLVAVLRDGIKTRETFHMDFWKVESE